MKDLEHLASIMLVKKVPYNSVIIEQGQETDALYFIKSGEVRIVRRMQPTKVRALKARLKFEIPSVEVSQGARTGSSPVSTRVSLFHLVQQVQGTA